MPDEYSKEFMDETEGPDDGVSVTRSHMPPSPIVHSACDPGGWELADKRIAALERKVAELEVLLQQLRDDHEDERHLR